MASKDNKQQKKSIYSKTIEEYYADIRKTYGVIFVNGKAIKIK